MSDQSSPPPADIASLLRAGQNLIQLDDSRGAWDLIYPLVEQGAFHGEDYGSAALLLGRCSREFGHLDHAAIYLEQAREYGDSEARSQAKAEQKLLATQGAAVTAMSDGVSGHAEADSVLAAGQRAFEGREFDQALAYFSHAYSGIHMNAPRVAKAAFGMAQCMMEQGDTGEAEGYLQVAEQHDPTLANSVAAIRSWIAELSAGATSIENGVQRNEYTAVQRAANAAYDSGDYENAYQYFEQLLNSGVLAGTDIGRVNYNLGLCCTRTGSHDAAHQYFTAALETGSAGVVSKAQLYLRAFEGIDHAQDIAAQLTIDRD